MDTLVILDQLGELGISVTVVEGNLRVQPASKLPEALRAAMRQHKTELLQHLLPGSEELHRQYRLRYPGSSDPDLVEAEEIAELLEREGCVLMWSNALHDYLGIYRAEVDRSKVPVGFVPYSEEELLSLWFGGAPSLSLLRQVHEAKKQGGRIIS